MTAGKLKIQLTGIIMSLLLTSFALKAKPESIAQELWAVNDDAFELIKTGRDYSAALKLLDSTLHLALIHNLTHLASDCYSQKSTIAQRQDELSEAMDLAHKALSLRRKLGLTMNIGDSHNNIGLIHIKLGDLDSAVFHIQKGLEIWQEIGNDTVIASLQTNLSDALFKKGELDKALEVATNSLDIMTEFGEQAAVAYNRLCLGNIYLELGAYDSAESQYRMVETYAREVKDIPLLIKAKVALVGLLGERDRKDEALKLGEEAFKEFNENIDQYQIEYADFTKLMNQLGTIFQEQKRYEKAKQYYKQAVALSADRNSRSAVLAYINLGELYLETRQLKLADLSLKEGLQKVTNTRQNDLHRRLLDELAYVNAQLKNYDLAYEYSQAEDSLVDILDGSLRQAEASHFDTSLKQYEQAAAADRGILIRNFLLAIALITLIVGVIFYRQKVKETTQKAEAEKQKAEVQTQKLQIENLIESNKTDSILSMLKGQEEERGRIYVELHNQVGALFTLAKHPFELGFEALNKEIWDKLEQDIAQIQEKVRAISHKNGQTLLAQRYFADAVQELGEKTSANSNLEVETAFDFEEEKLSLDVRAKLYSVITELLNNAVKHSGAKSIEINLTEVEGLLNVMVIDDGRGFDQTDKDFEGQGVKIIHAIISNLSGTCNYDSQLGRGTTVNIEIPIDNGNS